MDFFAHTREGVSDTGQWQTLHEHEEGVAHLAKGFAAKFDAGPAGRLLGLWHDLGKYHPLFQERLHGATHRFEHAGAGAALAIEKDPQNGCPLAFAIAGHHGGLPNFKGGEGAPSTPLSTRVKNNTAILAALRGNVPAALLAEQLPPLPDFPKDCPESAEFWTRMIYSCLVDADWLNTEEFIDLERAQKRGKYDDIPTLQARLDARIDRLAMECEDEVKARPTYQVRQAILQSCREAASWDPGLFSLTAPTGSGKTLSALSFALKHAQLKEKDRVIVVIPYTSIIEQNARVYSDALGLKNVLEHHANLDPKARRDEMGDEITERHELATENWDAPVIVTTSVQFFESLFSNKRGRCRKLHNIAKSVIVFDEVQALPAGFRYPILNVIAELCDHYKCSLVLSTATQPALARRDAMKYGLSGVREIVPDPDAASESLSRVGISFPDPDAPPVTWEELADDIAKGFADKRAESRQALIIVHKRNDAREVAELMGARLPETPLFHLSALMCPKHRLEVLDTVRELLEARKDCCLISTQLIEAGVDVDFPVVYRALGGLDSIIQAAGRCNRGGRPELGKVVVFRAPTKPPPGTPSQGLEVMESLLRECPGLRPHRQESIENYFKGLYAAVPADQAGIQGRRKEFKFAEVGQKFKLIEDGFTQPIYVPYGDGAELISELGKGFLEKDLLKQLQSYQVSAYKHAFPALLKRGQIFEVVPGLYAVAREYPGMYDPRYGLLNGDEVKPDADAFVF
ncbi:MAG: CRISPR-associated helicase Cas3' [Candidatus Hydrogenedentes bacterium]|nr:CRISPR-associated helicase Cas3' [Candidatus Hydrogenedentota bacterium]